MFSNKKAQFVVVVGISTASFQILNQNLADLVVLVGGIVSFLNVIGNFGTFLHDFLLWGYFSFLGTVGLVVAIGSGVRCG